MAKNLVLGVFTNHTEAGNAVSELEANGYDAKEISLIVKDQVVTDQTVTTTAENVAAGAAQGVTSGGVVGGLVGLLVGIGAIAIPGIGGILIGGPLAAALGLTGAAATAVSGAATGALAGGIVGSLVGLGLPEETARFYEDRLREGGVLLAVSPKGKVSDQRIQEIFVEANAQQVHYLA